MAYTPFNWQDGDTITAEKLNNIESGIEEVSSGYVATTWETGDVITAQKLNNIEQGIANAGLPSAEVTLTSTNDQINCSFYGIKYDEETGTNYLTAIVPSGTLWHDELWFDGEIDTTLDFVLLTENFEITVSNATSVNVTGNATSQYFEENNQYVITVTGDCTIAIA